MDDIRVNVAIVPDAPHPLASLTPHEADVMTSKAWREAVRCWREARAYTGQDVAVRTALFESACSAEAWYEAVRDAARQKWASVCGVTEVEGE